MLKKSLLASLVLVATSSAAFANGGSFAPAPVHTWCQNFYLGVEGGFSVSSRMNFKANVDDLTSYHSNPVGFGWIFPGSSEWPDDMGTEPFVGVDLGYTINNVLSTDLDYSYRSDFRWERLFSLNGVTGDPTSEVGERYTADINVQTLLLGLNLTPDVDWGGLKPFGQVGVGIGWNDVSNFRNYDVATPSGAIAQTFNIHLHGNRETSFAWKIGAGLDYTCPMYNQLHFLLGYRFVDAGSIETGNSFVDTVNGPTPGRSDLIPQFKADHVQLHESYIGAVWHFG